MQQYVFLQFLQHADNDTFKSVERRRCQFFLPNGLRSIDECYSPLHRGFFQ